jgi:hypothetical protein
MLLATQSTGRGGTGRWRRRRDRQRSCACSESMEAYDRCLFRVIRVVLTGLIVIPAMSAMLPIVFSNSGSGCQVLQRSSLPGPLFSPR